MDSETSLDSESMDKNLFHLKAEVIKSEEEGVIDAVIASTQVLDRQGDVINQDGWDLSNYKKNAVVLWGHNVKEERPPIGKAIKVWIEGEGKKAKLMFKTQFDMADKFASEIYRKVKDGFINMVSVGFLPLEWEPLDKNEAFGGNRFLKQELLEISFVPVPANPQAAVQIRSMGVEPIDEDKLYPQIEKPKSEDKDLKGVIPFKATDTVPETSDWDGPGEMAKASVEDLKEICAWYDTDAPEVKSSYKLPHHQAVGHKVVWRGVLSSMALLLGAKGGVKIPEEDRKGVYNHLVKHYKQYDKEAPEFRMVEEQVLKGLDNELASLALEREDRYTVRLLKKLIDITKEKEKKDSSKISNIISALDILNKGMNLRKGGEK